MQINQCLCLWQHFPPPPPDKIRLNIVTYKHLYEIFLLPIPIFPQECETVQKTSSLQEILKHS